jgi:hypothetical protein
MFKIAGELSPFSKRGAEVVRRNFEAVDATLAQLHGTCSVGR